MARDPPSTISSLKNLEVAGVKLRGVAMGGEAAGRAGVVREAERGRSAARHEVMSRGGVCITHLDP